jgi:hypothetical protein
MRSVEAAAESSITKLCNYCGSRQTRYKMQDGSRLGVGKARQGFVCDFFVQGYPKLPW